MNNHFKPKFPRRQSREDLYCENCGLNGHDKGSCRVVDLNALILKKLQEHFDKIGDSGEKTVNKQRSKQEWGRKDYIQQSSHVVQTTVKAPSQKRSWILDSGCSSHMTGDKSEFSKLAKYDGGNVRFGNNERAKIVGKGVVKMARGSVTDVLYVEGLQNSLLSVSQICSKGHEVTFKSDGVDIRRVSDGKIIAGGVRTSGDLYTLSNDVDGSCFVSQDEEHWLWNKRMGHIGFYNLAKISSKEGVHDMTRIKVPDNPMCEACQKGKQSRATHPEKEYHSTGGILDLLHMDLCGPMR
ncbi:GAG-pre-integrase domain-containing protein, partial [Serratia marcescens]|nr:GAG-pre-integrase domain-containing protein [Serratia marcescens]